MALSGAVGVGRSKRSRSQRPEVLEPLASACKLQRVQEDIPQNNSNEILELLKLPDNLLEKIFGNEDVKVLCKLRKTCKSIYKQVKVPIKGTNYVFSDIQLMRSFDFFLQQTYQLNIDNQLLRSILKDLKKIESAFSVSQSNFREYMPPSLEAYKDMAPQSNHFVHMLTIGEMTLKIFLDKGSQFNITGISILNSKIRGYTLPQKKIVQFKKNNVIENEAGVQTCDCLTLANGYTYENWKLENGVQTCDRLTLANRTTYKNWKFENGVETCDRLTLPNGDTYEKWKFENGVQTCDRLTLPNGDTYEKWKLENGVQTCDCLTHANGNTLKNWKIENGVETCDCLTIKKTGNTLKNWKRENDVETCDCLTIKKTGNTYENWMLENGVETCDPLTLATVVVQKV